jgi:solute carrier family 25 oxoglutarate transporter 11
MRQAVYGSARIGLHRAISNHLLESNGGVPLSFASKVGAGMVGGAIAVSIGTPFDVALVRMQSDTMREASARRNYSSVFDALIRVGREEGFLALYSGLAPNILRGMSMNVGQMACYDQAKELVSHHITNDDPTVPKLETRLLSSAIAGFTAAAFSLPFDLLKSRLQDSNKYKGLTDVFVKTLRYEGVTGFWTGFSAYYLRCAPHAMIILMTVEPLTQLYREEFVGVGDSNNKKP